MSIIKVSIDKIYGILEPVDLELIKERVEVSNRMLSDGSGDGNDFLGWVDLPEQITPAQLDAVNDCAKSLASLAEVIVVIGIGFLNGLVKHFCDLSIRIVHTRKDLFIHLCDPLGGFTEPLPVRVITQGFENAADVGFDGFGIDHSYTPC